MKRLNAVVASSTAVFVLVACGNEDGQTAEDPAPSSATASPSSTPSVEPTTEPSVGTYPPYAPESYTYHLSVSCFCVGAGVPIKVTVDAGAVVKAVYLADDHGRSPVKKGDPADKSFWLTINDIIEAANNTSAARVDVDWPEGQDYPNSVYVDEDEQLIDEEVGYTLSKVKPQPA